MSGKLIEKICTLIVLNLELLFHYCGNYIKSNIRCWYHLHNNHHHRSCILHCWLNRHNSRHLPILGTLFRKQTDVCNYIQCKNWCWYYLHNNLHHRNCIRYSLFHRHIGCHLPRKAYHCMMHYICYLWSTFCKCNPRCYHIAKRLNHQGHNYTLKPEDKVDFSKTFPFRLTFT